MSKFTVPVFHFDRSVSKIRVSSDNPEIYVDWVSKLRDQAYVFKLNWGSRVIFFSARYEWAEVAPKTYEIQWTLHGSNVPTVSRSVFRFAMNEERNQAVELELAALSKFHHILTDHQTEWSVRVLPVKAR